jgi:hypothetical protein
VCFKSSCVDQAVSPNAVELALYFCLAAFLDDCIPSSAKTLSVGHDNTQHLSLGVIALCFRATDVHRAVESLWQGQQACARFACRCGCLSIGLSLFPNAASETILRWLFCGLQWLESGNFQVSSKAALSKACQRLGRCRCD